MTKTAFLFPGQGAQVVGMGRAVAQDLPAARALYDQAAQILGYDLADVCWNGPAERLNSTVISQPAIFVTSLAALEKLKAEDAATVAGVQATAGLSLGEYTALVLAGALDFAAALGVVKCRGEAMQAASDATAGGMVSILGLERSVVEEICQAARGAGTLEIANLLCPGNTVLSGARPACDLAEKLAHERGGRTVRLAVAGAFHTELMKPADDKLAEALAQVDLRPPRIPVWSNVDGRPHTDPAEIRLLLKSQVVRPVQWELSIRNLLAEGFDCFYEIGPGRVLAGLLKRVQRKADCRNITTA
jgi:[acyl-carrier-protein] S-malonyltransferase